MNDDEKFLSMMRALSDPNRLASSGFLRERDCAPARFSRTWTYRSPPCPITCPSFLTRASSKPYLPADGTTTRSTRMPGPSLSRTSGRSSEIQTPGSRKEVAGCLFTYIPSAGRRSSPGSGCADSKRSYCLCQPPYEGDDIGEARRRVTLPLREPETRWMMPEHHPCLSD